MRNRELTGSDSGREQTAVAWSRYWARGALHSCPNAFPADYGAEIRMLWAEFFAAQPSGARILDIGTGNGAIAFIARDTGTQRACAFEIEAIDLARIAPEDAAAAHGVSTQGVTFRGGVASDATGYPDAWFDAVSSQFALEYMPIEPTLHELARIVKPAGGALFVIHHAASRALLTTRHELGSFDFLQHRVPLLVSARRYLRRLEAARTVEELQRLANDSETAAQAREIEGMVARVVDHARTAPEAGFVGAIAAQVVTALRETRTAGPAAGLERLRVLEEEMQAHRERLRAIGAAARGAQGIGKLARQLREAGFAPHPARELKVKGDDLIGWVLHATRVGQAGSDVG